MKKLISVLLLAAVLIPSFSFISVPIYAADYSGSCGDDLTWSYDPDTNVIEISGTGDMYNYTATARPEWEPYCADIKEVIIGDEVTSVGEYAFSGYESLSAITIGNSVERIGDSAFYYTYDHTITLPMSIKYIGPDAFGVSDWSLLNLYYPGTEEQWNAVTLDLYIYDLNYTIIHINSEGIKLGKCGEELTWRFDIETGVFEISGNGAMTGYSLYVFDIPWQDFNDKITEVIVGDSVTSIGKNAFYYCSNLKQAVIGKSVKTIKTGAFYKCSLKDIYYQGLPSQWEDILVEEENDGLLGADMHYFYDTVEGKCGDTLSWFFDTETFTLSITGMGEMYDYNTENPVPWAHITPYIKRLTLESGITYLGDNALENFSALSEVVFKGSVEEWDSIIKGENNEVLESVSINFEIISGVCGDTLIWKYDKEQRTLSIEGTGRMYDYGFYQNKTPWSDYAEDVRHIKISDSVEHIGSLAFAYFEYIKEIEIPSSVKSIGADAFEGCIELRNVYVNDLVSWCEIEFETMYSSPMVCGYYFYVNGTEVRDITIPDSIKVIRDYSFNDFDFLRSVTMGNSVTEISAESFSYCYNMESVILGDSVERIGLRAFFYSDFTNIELPDSVEYIGGYAFDNTGYYNDPGNWTGELLYIGNHLVASSNAAKGEYEIREGTVTVADCTFVNKAITDVTIPESVKNIGENTFKNCDKLVILCNNKNSYAYKFAVDNDIPYRIVCDHSFTDYISNNDATCVSDGTMTAYCDKECGTTDTIIDKGSATGIHKFGDWVVTSKATYVSEGEKARYCLNCDAYETQMIAILTLQVSVDNYTVTVNCTEHIKDMRYAPGVHTTPSEIKAAEGNVAFSNALVQKYSKDGILTYEMPKGGYYTIWIRMTDGTEYILPLDVTHFTPAVTANGVTVTLRNLYDVKDFYIAKGEYHAYREIKDNGYIFSATAAKIADKHDYTYTVYEPGVHTVLIRYNDGTQALFHEILTVDEPTLTVNGLQVTIGNIPDVKVIRTAYGEWNSTKELKATDTIRNYTNKTDIKDSDKYILNYNKEGTVTVIVEYNNGYKKVFHCNIEQNG